VTSPSRSDEAAQPPGWAERLLAFCLPPGEVAESVLGDLHQEYLRRARGGSSRAADRWYGRQAAAIALRYLLRSPLPESAAARSSNLPPPRKGDPPVANLLHDLRIALRGFRRRPAFTAAAVVSLGLGIGTATAIFGVVYGLLLRPLPFPEPGRLVSVEPRFVGPDGFEPGAWSYPYFEAFRDGQQAFSHVAAYATAAFNLTADDPAAGAERVRGEYVSADYFRVLAVDPLHGRAFTAEEDLGPESPPAALLGHGLWRRRFAGDPSVIGRPVRVDGVPIEVVGVMPEGFAGLPGSTELWLSLPTITKLQFARRLALPFSFWHQAVGRLAPGVTPEEAAASLEAISLRVTEVAPPLDWAPESHLEIAGTPTGELRVDRELASRLRLLLAAVALLLLVACANVANLLLARGVRRRRELRVRAALGADGGRLSRQLLTETALLGLAGGAAGLAFAAAAVRGLRALRPADAAGDWGILSAPSVLGEVRLDPAVWIFAVGAALVSGLLLGAIPALQARREGRGSGPGPGAGAAAGLGPRRPSGRGALVVAQVLLAVVLLAGAGLMVRSFQKVLDRDPGFDPDGVLTAQLQLPKASYPEEADKVAAWGEILDGVAALPGVEAASLDVALPLADNSWIAALRSPAIVLQEGEPEPAVGVHAAGPDHFRVLGTPLLRGRGFEPSDGPGAPKVAVVSRTAAETLWPGRSALGQQLWLSIGWEEGELAEVVGVADDVEYAGLDTGEADVEGPGSPELAGHVYVPYGQLPGADRAYLLMKADTLAGVGAGELVSRLAPLVHSRVREVDAALPIYDVMTLEDRVERAYSALRFSALCLAFFGLVALALAAVGVYGVMAWSVSERTSEIGVRMSLGARPGHLVRMVLGEGLALTAVGLVLGIAAALGVGRTLASQLVEVEPADPAVLAGAAAVLAVAAALACWLPARRAARLDPTEAIRRE
jgi:putative ABC transport system permease protein